MNHEQTFWKLRLFQIAWHNPLSTHEVEFWLLRFSQRSWLRASILSEAIEWKTIIIREFQFINSFASLCRVKMALRRGFEQLCYPGPCSARGNSLHRVPPPLQHHDTRRCQPLREVHQTTSCVIRGVFRYSTGSVVCSENDSTSTEYYAIRC